MSTPTEIAERVLEDLPAAYARVRELEAALAEAETFLTAFAVGFARNVPVGHVCAERHLTAVLRKARAALGNQQLTR